MGSFLKINTLQDFFATKDKRPIDGTYFERIDGYSEKVRDFLCEYYAAALSGGVIVEGGLSNPDNSQLAYYNGVLGNEFRMDKDFILQCVRHWLPGLDDRKQSQLASSIFEVLDDLRSVGKNDNALKNVYVKFLCWLYYRFESVFHSKGNSGIPKILYDGPLTQHAVLLLHVLSDCGCDIILLELQGDSEYLKLDPDSKFSHLYQAGDSRAFPSDFSLAVIRKIILEKQEQERLLGPEPQFKPATNIWLSGNVFRDIQRDPQLRGDDPRCFYNAFCRIRGVEDKVSYEGDLYRFQLELKKAGRKILIVNDSIPAPTVDEIAEIKRGNYQNAGQLATGLSPNIRMEGNPELERMMRRSFVELILDEGKREDLKLGRLTSQSVYLLCWLKKYSPALFLGWKMPDVSCFIYLGGCRDENEALFFKYLSKLPVDTLILNPDLNRPCSLTDDHLFEKEYEKSLRLTKYPENETGLRLGTTAFHAEQDLDSIMYGDTGLYRNRQFSRASIITLQTMYEEIPVLWDQELKYRPNFSTVDDQVNIPVICSKISGVKGKDLAGYWGSVKALMTEETVVYRSYPRITTMSDNPFISDASWLIQNGRLLKDKIKTHDAYAYGLLKESVQDYILDKIQLLISSNLIKNDGNDILQNRILAVLLNLDKILVRLIQNFDFTKKNPKLIGISTGDTVLSKEDAIVLAFLNIVGFDIALFVPTGYQCVEQYYTRPLLDEHQIGEYMYDLLIPDFDRVSTTPRKTLKDIFFRRGN